MRLLPLAFLAASLATAGLTAAQAASFKVVRTLAMPTATDFRGCNVTANTSFLNDRGEVAAGCAYQYVKFGLNPATLLFGFYGVQRNKLLYWSATAASAKVVANPSGHSADSLLVMGLSNAGQALVYPGMPNSFTWSSSAGWKEIKFSGQQQVRSFAPTGEVLGDINGYALEYWRDGVLTPWALPAIYRYILGEAPSGPLYVTKDGAFDQLYMWRPGVALQPMPMPEGRQLEYLVAANASGQFVLSTVAPGAGPSSTPAAYDRRLHVYDGQRFQAMPDNGQGEFSLLKLSAGGQALVSQWLMSTGTREDWLLANGQWTSLRQSVGLPSGVTYDQAVTVNGLGHVLVQAKQNGRTVWLVCVPN